LVIYDVLNVLKLMGKHFIDPKSSEILSIFQVFPCMMQIALFWPKLLPALFLKKPWYPCPFEIREEALKRVYMSSWVMHDVTQVQKWPSSSKVSETNAIDIGNEFSGN
jgi:hypothetical protein